MKNENTKANITLRPAAQEDAGTLLALIRELAEYEHLILISN